jgi:hypothetical protein
MQNPYGDVPDQNGVLGGLALIVVAVIAWFIYALFKKN